MRTLRIGLLGLGTVGRGVIRILQDNREAIRGRLGAQLEVKRALVRDLEKPRRLMGLGPEITTNPDEVLDDPEIHIVVELVGGIVEAKRFVLRAIESGKHVVTANKALLASEGDEIFQAARERNVDVFYEGAVAGGIPIIRTIRESLASERIQSVVGILNGTTNFILSEMLQKGAGFDETLREAQRLGYAEADPTADIDGHDAAQKLAILASLAFSMRVRARDVSAEGIRNLTYDDLADASARGHAVKLIGVAERRGAKVVARVYPAWVPNSSVLAHVDGVQNAVLLKSDALGTSILIGQGAGELPTGSAVVADIIDSARNVLLGTAGRIPAWATRDEALGATDLLDASEVETAFCLKFWVTDIPGVLGRMACVLGEHNVSIRSVHQDAREEGQKVPVLVLTHRAKEGAALRAIREIDALGTTISPTRIMRTHDAS
jgi:homoserine dehydrogenase